MYQIEHHNKIFETLNNFNAKFLADNNIYFGGGTRIALELDEFRESVDIDLLCPTIESYRAVRNTVLSNSLGELVNREFNYLREISFDRYSVRSFINVNNTPIKIEVVSFDRHQLSGRYDDLFPIPYLDKESCFYTKLLANADRAKLPPYKDITDILFMIYHWGDIPESSLFNAKLIYGNVIEKQLKEAVLDIQSNKNKYLKELKNLSISKENISIILNDSVEKLSNYLINKLVCSYLSRANDQH